jgi:hypothetical protein
VYSASDRLLITGDFEDKFLELYLPPGELIDQSSPVLLRRCEGKPDCFEITFLRSDAFDTQARKLFAVRRKLLHAGEAAYKAGSGDCEANCAVGQFILWELDDPAAARPYLECAVEAGSADAALDLALILLFCGSGEIGLPVRL